jgi:hypothetical protein
MLKCFECGNNAQHNHHVIPKSKGGVNTVPLCEQCHYKVHNITKTDCAYLTSEAMQQLINNNKKFSSQAPFGFSFDSENNMIEDPTEQKTLKLIQDLRADKMSYREIEAELKKQNIRNRSNGFYTFAFIGKILNRKGIRKWLQ